MKEKKLPAVDEPPSSGKYVDHDDLGPLTDEEAKEGEAEREQGGSDDSGK